MLQHKFPQAKNDIHKQTLYIEKENPVSRT